MVEAPQWVRSWAGGRVRLARDGSEVFVIERRIGVVRKAVTLHVDTEKAAEVELSRFEDDPANYTKKKERTAKALAGAVRFDLETVGAFLKEAEKRVEKGDLTRQYKNQILAPYLTQWAKVFSGRDIRRIELGELRAQLKRWTTAHHKRVVALKAFTAWLREEDMLKPGEDPTLELKTPEIVPAKSIKVQGYPIALIEKLYSEVEHQAARDIIRLRCTRGMHDTEIDRVARGNCILRRVDDPSGITGVLVFAHLKKGKQHALSLDAAQFAACERLMARGKSLSRPEMKRQIDRVVIGWHGCGGLERVYLLKRGERQTEIVPCKKCSRIRPGELRHSFATWAKNFGERVIPAKQAGVPLDEVAEEMGHTGRRTTGLFYVDVLNHVPKMIKVPVKLVHSADP